MKNINRPIGELQQEYLSKLLLCNKHMTIGQALHRVSVLNQYVAYYSVLKS